MSGPGRLNCYTCRTCGKQVITVDTDEGVTPFMIECKATEGCAGEMISSMYRVEAGEPTFEWRKPTPEEFAKASPGMRNHFNKGGLDIYPLHLETVSCLDISAYDGSPGSMLKPYWPTNSTRYAWIPQTMGDCVWVLFDFATKDEREAFEASLGVNKKWIRRELIASALWFGWHVRDFNGFVRS